MPTYEYRCPQGHVFEKFYPTITEKRRLSCPTCGKRAERIISGGAGLVFKGSGFYATDYKRPGSAPKSADGSTSDTAAKPDTPGKADKQKASKPDSSSSEK